MRLTDIKPIRKFYGWACRKHAAFYLGGTWIERMREKHGTPEEPPEPQWQDFTTP